MAVYYFLVGVPVLIVLLQTNGVLTGNVRIRITSIYGRRENRDISMKNAAIVSFFLIWFFILAFRHKNIGADTGVYLRHFDIAGSYGIIKYLSRYSNEHGFYLLTKLISMLGASEQIYLVIMAAISIVPIAILYSKEAENQLLAISFFLILPVFNMPFSGLRQSVAIAIVVYAYQFVKQKNLKKFILFILAASLFHQSALIAVLLYPVYHMKWSRMHLIWIVPSIAFVYIFNGPLYLILVRFLGNEYSSYGEVSETGAYMMLLLFVLCLAFSYFFLEQKKTDMETQGLRNILTLATVFQCFTVSNPIAMRINYYFIVFVPLLIPRVINRCLDKNRRICRIIGWVMTGYFLFYYFRRAHTGVDILQMYPYIPFWH